MKNLLFILSLILLASCGSSKKVLFTDTVRKTYNLDSNTLGNVQFWVSETIFLERSSDDQDASFTSNGEIILSDINNYDKIVIKKGTPCLFEGQAADGVYLFRFEDGANKVLPFGVSSDDTYTLLAKNWNRGIGVIKYGGKTYTTTDGNVQLKVIIKHIRKGTSSQKDVLGKKIRNKR
jgi:hypothetical protein